MTLFVSQSQEVLLARWQQKTAAVFPKASAAEKSAIIKAGEDALEKEIKKLQSVRSQLQKDRQHFDDKVLDENTKIALRFEWLKQCDGRLTTEKDGMGQVIHKLYLVGGDIPCPARAVIKDGIWLACYHNGFNKQQPNALVSTVKPRLLAEFIQAHEFKSIEYQKDYFELLQAAHVKSLGIEVKHEYA